MADLSNEIIRHKHAHNHTSLQETESYILRIVFKFFEILTFSALRVVLRLMKKSKNSHLLLQGLKNEICKSTPSDLLTS